MKWVSYPIAVFTFLILSSNSCDSSHEPCPKDIICTMIFTQISVQVVDENDERVVLTKAEVSSKHLNQSIDPLVESHAGGPYLLVNDGHKQFLSHAEDREFIFKGWVNDDLVVDETYLLRHDCCHVQLIEGKEKVTVNSADF